MPTALIAEDEELLAQHLRQELAGLWPDLEVVAMAAHGQAAVDLALQHLPQVCFFDIRMPGMTGLEAAAMLADEWPDGPGAPPFPLLVFVTAYDQYALQAFDRAAVDYVLKPVQRERLAQTVMRLRAGLAARAAGGASSSLPSSVSGPPAVAASPMSLEATLDQLRSLLLAGGPLRDFAPQAPQATHTAQADVAAPRLRHLQVGVGQGIVLLPVEQIEFLEAADKYVRVLTADQEYLVRISLRELLPQLDPDRFWQVHRGHVVQVDAIERALRDDTGRLTLKLRHRPERLAVSRMFAHRFKAM
ncbi:LytR/AlgR family response regulator transcription factor [Roseateles terrae]|uniref:DNA-binding LytR/AlgR family response regulator n=1 Tax=Roseateles terrae TaxID=431060 RepID=A0ABR6GPT3_9BURK|nr:LytTR family DNA-binding domain-containing protein [Roseateles terrae]MBB3194079.1 DNA-binding LytR/AlgR family response regulator [Roseateles terrae]OWQ87942.1 hypothetical protein CDN98_07255 [Roseateles terrae]